MYHLKSYNSEHHANGDNTGCCDVFEDVLLLCDLPSRNGQIICSHRIAGPDGYAS